MAVQDGITVVHCQYFLYVFASGYMSVTRMWKEVDLRCSFGS